MASSLPDHLKKWFQALMTEPATLELVKGVVEGDEALVRSALARGARPDVTFPTIAGSSGCLVCVAASRGNDHLLPHLLQAGLNIEGGGTDDKTPLMEAAGKGNPQTVKVLLSLGANPRATDRQGRTALHYAAGYGHQECVAALLSVYPATATHLEGDTPVHFASYHGQVQVLEQLAGAGWPLTARDSGGSTPLHYAAEGGHISAVRWLVLRGGDLRVQDKYGHTPLTMAVHCGHHQVETWLAKNGGGGVIEGSEAPHVSVKAVREWRNKYERDHNTVLSWLVEGNMAAMDTIPEVTDGHVVSRDGLTPLHAAALCGAPSGAVKSLLGRGVSPHVFTPDCQTPADLAQQKSHRPVIQALHAHQCPQGGASPDQLYEELLSTVSRGDHVQEVSHLLCKGVPLESWGGHSVLKLAVTNDRARTVNLLLASGASLSASLLQKAWQSPNVTPQVLASLTTAYCCRLRAEKRRLVKISSVLVKGIKSLLKDIEGNTPWRTAWRWGKGTDRAALSDLLAKTAAANCPVTASFLHSAGAWTSFSQVSHGSALHAALDAGHQCMAELLIRDLGACPYVPDSVGRLPLDIITHEERRYHLEQKLLEMESEKLENMVLSLKADHEKKAARTALRMQKVLFEDRKISILISSIDARNTLLLASRKCLLQLIYCMLQNGCILVDEVLDNICGTTALHQAASHGQNGCVELLLSAGANHQQGDRYGQTPGHLAAMFGHKSIYELLEHRGMQGATCYAGANCRAGTTAMQVRDNFKIFLTKYWKYNRKLHLPSDHHDPQIITRNLVKAITLEELQDMTKQVVVDLSKGEALEVKEAVLSEIGIIMRKVSAANPTYCGDLRLAGSSQDGSKLYAPDEFDINLVIHEDDIEVNVSKRAKEEATLKGSFQISIKTSKADLQGNRFMAGLYEEVHRCLAGHILEDRRLSLVPPGLTSTQVGVALTLAWQGEEYPLLLIGVDLVPVLEVPWLEHVSRPFLTPEDTTTMQLSNAADGTWRCSFALTEAKVLKTLSPAERQVQLMGKILLSRLKAEPWMPYHKKRFFKWFSTREWNIAVPSGFCFKNALLRWVQQKRWEEVAGTWDANHIQELKAGQERDHSQELGAGQEGDHSQELGAGQEGELLQGVGGWTEKDLSQELEAGQEGDLSQELGARQEGDQSQEMEAGQERNISQELGAGQEGDHFQELEAGQQGDDSQQLGTGQRDLFRWVVQVFRLMCANPKESREHLATQNSSAYFGGECEGRKSGEGAPVIVQCLEEELEKLCYPRP
ncbi:LOW QUALITY PROTEIN: ankyrin-2-like [Portunus trituberculatus]|uniref:LOW QUALITY PROTEIN: ankyrin-2-like n=1 Tax=Portunus trituberculatus TaxID=210409 RepID=UPI001E1D1B05|nr:LOW QUALITY PROTEIN: ankyrin-2-like [Portunus trituberculatus]